MAKIGILGKISGLILSFFAMNVGLIYLSTALAPLLGELASWVVWAIFLTYFIGIGWYFHRTGEPRK